MRESIESLLQRLNGPKQKKIYGVVHTVLPDNAIDTATARLIPDPIVGSRHPLGSVYAVGEYGYVKDAENWLRFRLEYLRRFDDVADAAYDRAYLRGRGGMMVDRFKGTGVD